MKRKLLVTFLSALCIAGGANAQEDNCKEQKELKPISLASTLNTLPTEDQEGVVYFYHETFNKIGGSIETPEDFDLGGNAYGNIAKELLDEENFTVAIRGCQKAGEAVLVKGEGAYLNIALGEMRGRGKAFDIYFRIKSETSETSLFSITTTNSAMILDGFYGAIVPTEWNWYSVHFDTGNGDTRLEFVTENEEIGFLIDEIIVVVNDTFLNGPTPLPATNADKGVFTANWFYSYDAKGVYLDVFSYADELSTRETKEETENFEDISIVDGKLNMEEPGMPEKWNYRFTKTMDKVFPKTDKGYSIVLNKAIEYLSTPNYDEAPYTKFSFDLKAQENATGKLIVEERIPRLYTSEDLYINNPYEWAKIGELDLTEYISETKSVDLTSNLSGNGIYVRFTVVDNNDKGAEISNVSYTYGGDIIKAKNFEIQDLQLSRNDYTADGLDPNKEWFYRLRTFDDNYVSDYSLYVRANGKVPSDDMVAPEVLDAENISAKGFTAKWLPSIYTHSYICEVFREYEAQKDIDNFVFMSEDFNTVFGGTIEEPIYGTIKQFSTIDNYGVLPGFMIDHGLKAEGMMGIYNVYDPSKGWAYGHLNSPVYSMPDNRDFHLNITAVGKAGLKFKVSCFNDEGREIETTRVGTFTMDNTPEEFTFKFPTSNYTFFEIELMEMENAYTILFDKMEIAIDLEKGDVIRGLVDESHTMTASYDFKTPYWTENDKIYYQVKSRFSQPNQYYSVDYYTSDPSRKVYVDYTGIVGIDNISTSENEVFVLNGELNVILSKAETVYVYNLSGVLTATYKAKEGLNIYPLKDNGVYIIKIDNQTVKVIK